MTMVTKSFEIRGNFDTVTMRDWISHRSAVLGLHSHSCKNSFPLHNWSHGSSGLN